MLGVAEELKWWRRRAMSVEIVRALALAIIPNEAGPQQQK